MKQFSIKWLLPIISIFRHQSHPTAQIVTFAIFMFAVMPSFQANNGVMVSSELKPEVISSLSADLSLTKSVNNSTPAQNSVITYTLTLSNAGPDPATDAEVTDVVPAGLTYVVGSQTGPGTYVNSAPATTGLKWQHLAIPNGGSVVLTFQATVTASSGTIANFAQVTASVESDPDSSPNNGTSPNPAEDDEAAVSITVVQPVVLTCPVNTTAGACLTQATVDVLFDSWLASATASGGCNGVLTNNNTGAPSACGGATTVTFTYTSTCAPLTTTCQATFSVTAPGSPTPVFANCTNNTVDLGCNPSSLPSCAGIASGSFGGAVTASNSCGAVPVNCTAGTIMITGCNRSQTFTFDATACGQTVTCTRTFTWFVVTPPQFNNCMNQVFNLGCNPSTLPACDPTITAFNECGPLTVNCSAGAITSNGCDRTQTLAYQASNPAGCGSFSICFHIYNWQETTAPVITNCDNTIDLGCNPATQPTCANVQTAPFGGPISVTNECGTVSGVVCDAGQIMVSGCNRSQTFTFTVTACGFTSTCTRTFTWQVVTAPVFANCTTGTTPLGCNPSVLPTCDPTVTASNECGPVTVTCTPGTITTNGCVNTQVFTYTADACGLTSSCSRTYTWTMDTAPPAFTFCPPGGDLGCNPIGVPGPGAATATDDCGPPTITSALGPITSNGCIRSQTRTYTATDGCGNTAFCTQTFTWTSDVLPPVFTFCPPGGDLGCNPVGVPGPGAATATDACGTPTITSALGAITSNGCLRSQTRNYTATDGCGNTATCAQVFTWTSDTTPPVLSGCPPPTVNLGCNPATIPTCANVPPPTATDACGTPTVTCTETGITVNGCLRTKTITWTVTDACNNTASCSTVYNWTVDTTPPVISGCPPPTVNLGCNPSTLPTCASVPAPTATDSCGTPTVTCTETGITVNGCDRTKTITWTATDACNNTASCSTVYNWQVVTAPVFSNCTTGTINLGCVAVEPVCDVTVTASNECGPVTVTCTPGAITVNGCNKTQSFTYVASGCGLSSTCVRTYNWTFDPPMTLTCPVNTTAGACLTQATVDVQFASWLATATVSGGCNVVLTNNNTGAPSACGGSTTVTFTATGGCGTTTTCQATFTVTAPPPVVLTCPTNMTTASCQTQNAVNAAFAAWLATASGSGGCNGVLTNNNAGAPSICGGSTTVTFTYTSSCAPTTTTCTATFTVQAPPPVVLTCPVNMTTTSCQTQAAVNAAFATWLATASGSGGCNGVLTNNNAGAPSACGGSTTVVFTYTSTCAPFTTTCSATFTVQAPPPVVLTCPVNTTTASCQTQAAVDAAFVAWLATASASGGCNGVLTNNNTGAPDACGGSTTVTFSYSSTCAPLTTTCTATFTVPTAPPVVLTCPVNTTVSACLTQAQVNSVYAAWLASATATGGCNGVLTNNSIGAPLICSPVAVMRTVVFTYTSTCDPMPTTCTATFTLPAYPDFTVPANGASEVACPALIVQPTPPVVLDACGKTLTPTGPVIVNVPNPITCEGTRTYTWTYTDCSGHAHPWSHTITVERQPFSVPANSGSTVACPDQTDVVPTAPVVTSNCGEVLTPVVTSTPKPGCEGDRLYTFHYMDCEGNTADWLFSYHIEYLDFAFPNNETVTVGCPLNATEPVPPIVFDNCGKQLNAIGPVITTSNNNSGCEGSRTYAWTYSDCEGNSHVWSKTFVFGYTDDFFVYPDGVAYVGCLLYAQTPFPPTIYDYCGQEINVTGPVISGDETDCAGTRVFSYVYTDCGGHSHPWTFTYIAEDNEPPVGNCPNVDETDLACVEDVPCPTDYDFSSKIAELISAGGIFDVCSGAGINVELDSWSALWQCSDPDGDGIYTFGRTFYFRISDNCGNEMPNLCEVTYSGVCLPLETFPQSAWGNEGGEPGNTLPGSPTDLQTITTLLGQGPLTIGGSHRSLTLTDGQCVLNLVPGVGNPTILGNCIQTNCGGCNPAGPIGMKNALATNTISLILNMRYNVQYNNLTMSTIRAQSLSCIDIDSNIKVCAEGAGCKLQIFESDGTVHQFPYTIGGLLDLSNLFLDGNLALTDGQFYVLATAINNSVSNVNSYWNAASTTITCDPDAGDAPFTGGGDEEKSITNKPAKQEVVFDLAPNPANGEVVFSLPTLPERQEVTFEIYNSFGKQMLRKDYGKVIYVKDRVSLQNVTSGLYLVTVKAGGARSVQKLYVGKN